MRAPRAARERHDGRPGVSKKQSVSRVTRCARDPLTRAVLLACLREPRYHLHHVFPLTTCRAKPGDERGGASGDGCTFSILNPKKSFVCVAPSPEAAAAWCARIEQQARAACVAAGAKYDAPNVTYAVKL